MNSSIKLKKGDTVIVLQGKDRTKTGKVISLNHKDNKVTVEAVNTHFRFERKSGNKAGTRISFPAPMPIAKVMLVCPNCGKPTRVGASFLENGKKQRICKKCGKAL